MNSKAVLYDLAIAGIAMGGWLIPGSLNLDLVKALSISTSLAFSGRAYYTGLCLISKERRNDEKEAITYEAEVEFYDQLLGTNIEAALEVKALEVENRMLERMIPLMKAKTHLEHQLHQVAPIHPEMSDEDKEQAAKNAVEDAFASQENSSDRPQQISEEAIREKFPETMDATSWKAICKASGNGATKEEILKDVLQASDQTGQAYYELLKRKFL